ncbi:hypothetical protein ACGF0D_35095, partial [Kitasatospora sp. NPDC048298]|uniref:hypothetical protein n=1 Tax=Kitasatospora sp. NPDC048298 TaxID=3364049 RepID=UPI00371DDA60
MLHNCTAAWEELLNKLASEVDGVALKLSQKASAIRLRRMTFRCSGMVCGVGRQGFGVGLS